MRNGGYNMKRISMKLFSAVLTLCMLMTMISCVFGITASADEVTYDSGNMPDWFFTKEGWGDTTNDICYFSDGSTRFTGEFSRDFGTDLSNEEITFDFKSNSDWKLYLRCDADFKSGYVIGSGGGSLYIKKVDSTNALAYTESHSFAGYNTMQWHRYTIGIEDYDGYSVIYVKVDGRKVPFIDGFKFTPGNGFQALDDFDTNATVINGALWDFNPVQTGNTYVKVSPTMDGLLINPNGTMYFRSVDADLSGKTDTFRIALAGDSITHGATKDENGLWSITYNKELNKLFGNTFDVYNGGVSGGSAIKAVGGMKPYVYQNQFTFTKNFDADLVVIMFGTNDAAECSKTVNGESVLLEGDELAAVGTKFKADYKEIINAYLNKGIPVVLTTSPYNYNSGSEITIKYMVDWTVELAEEMGLPCLDMWDFSSGHPDWFYDKTHPNMVGKQNIAAHLYEFLTTSGDISLTKTPDSITVPDYSDDVNAHAAVLTDYDGKMSVDTFYSYKQKSGVTDLRYIDGSVGANFGAVSKDNFNLGTKWTVTFSNQLPNNNNGTVYNDEYNWSKYRSSTFKVGGLTFMIYHQYNSVDKYTYYAYRLFMFNDEIAEPCITNSYNVKASYKIEYNNGTIKITRTSDNTVLFDVDSSSVFNTIGNEYRFDNVGLTMCSNEYNQWCYWTDFSVHAEQAAEAQYNISWSDHGHVEYAGNPLDTTLTHYVGEKLTVTAVCDDFGCSFAKWVDANGNKLSNNPTYTLTLDEGENYLYAIFGPYVAYGEISLTATEGGSVTINGAAYNPNDDYEVGSTVTLGAVADEGYSFLYWTDENNTVLSTDAEFATVMPKIANFKAVFAKTTSDTASVIFANRIGEAVAIQEVVKGTVISLPEPPQSYGYTCNGWKVGEQVLPAGTEITINESTVIRAEYTKDAVRYTVTVEGGTVDGAASGTYKYNTKVTVIFDSSVLAQGDVFYGWHIASSENADSVISHSTQYTFYVGSDVSLTALVTTGDVEVAPIIDVTNVAVVNDGKSISFLTERTVPDSFTLVESGVIYTSDIEKISTMTLDNVGGNLYARKTVSTTPNGQMRMTLSSRDGSAITAYLTAYMTYIDKYGEYFTVYSDVFSGTTVSHSGTQDIIDEENDNF